jgi:catechol 2,3-dioxygenase-like lactoylglutathione lyase family enzyme
VAKRSGKDASQRSKSNAHRGRVLFDRDEELDDEIEASDADIDGLIAATKTYWERYLGLDAQGISSMLAPDVTRMTQRTRRLQQGSAEVVAGLAAEWEAFERPDQRIAEEMTLRSMEISVDDERRASSAVVMYWVEIEGGARWEYEDQGLVLQAWVKAGSAWKLAHQIDGWATDYDLDEDDYGEAPTFVFDYVYPVRDLQRAVGFYRTILGEPDAVTATQAIFGLRGARFLLDASGLEGHAAVRDSLPNGYAVIYVSDLAQARQRLQRERVALLGGGRELSLSGDRAVLAQDSGGNVFVLAQRSDALVTGAAAPTVRGLEGGSAYVTAARKLAEAWVRQDARSIVAMHGEDSQWFDGTITNARGLEAGGEDLEEALRETYWPRYDRSSQGLCVQMQAQHMRERKLGDSTIVSYLRTLTGTGPHPFRSSAFVTHVFSEEGVVDYTFIVDATRSEGLVVELDYTGHPVEDLRKADKFYSETLALGEPYTDDEWRGWWSNLVVYGAYTASPEDDGVPVAGRCNGYASFWVRSVDETMTFLRSKGVKFPVIPAINDHSGVDDYPGYRQAVSTDSEGNIVVFTEYSGRPR